MEFKKPNRHRRPLAPVPPRTGTAPAAPRPAPLLQPKMIEAERQPPKERSRARRRLLNKKTFVALGIVGCLAAVVAIRNFSSGDPNATAKKPDYQTILPKGKTIGELGGWKRVSPPNDQPVFAFTDAIDGIPVSVTEQPLPQSFKNNIDSQVADLAKKFNATDKINTGDTPVYIGTSVKGPQSVIFANNNLLILIKSEKKISDASWANYAASLLTS